MSPRNSEEIFTRESELELDTSLGVFHAVHIRSGSTEGVVLSPKSPDSVSNLLRLRIQSSCLFSESFKTTDCDCAAQLHESMNRVAHHGGIVVYLYEEGRGVGLANKMKAIHLQQSEGLTSAQAYERLALQPDARSDYNFVNQVLEQLYGKREWVLLTNNPFKESLARSAGIKIASVEALICDSGSPTVKAYLSGKAAQFGHRIK